MRRVAAEAVLALGLLAGSLAVTGWWLRSTLLDPNRTEKVAATVLESPEVRTAVAGLVADQVAEATGQDPAAVRATVDGAIANAPDLTFLADLVGRLHEEAIGSGTGAIALNADMLTPLIGPDLARQVAGRTVSVPAVSQLSDLRDRLDGWIAGLLAIAAVGIVSGFALHPFRPAVFRRLGWWLLGLSVWQLLIAWLIPAKLVPSVTDNPWALLAARAATASAEQMRPALIGLAVAGVASFLASWFWTSASRSRHTYLSPAGYPPPGPAATPGRSDAAWAAWAASNAAASRDRQQRPRPEERTAEHEIRFGSGHDRHDERDL